MNSPSCLSTNHCTASAAGLIVASSSPLEAVASYGLFWLFFVLATVLWPVHALEIREKTAGLGFYFVLLSLFFQKKEGN